MEIIHIVLGKANPNRMNGVNKVVYQLVSHQSATWRYAEVWGITSDLLHNYGARNFRTQLFLKPKNPFKVTFELKEAIAKTSRNTIFHLHGGWVPHFYSIVKYLKKHKRKVVLTPHGSYNTIAMRKNKIIKKLYFEIFEKPMLKRLDQIHCIGQSEQSGLNKIFKNDKQTLVPYGFDLPQSTKKISKPGNEFTIGFVGRIDIYTKGLDLMLTAFSMFKHPAKLWIVGDGTELAKLKKMAATLGLEDSVIFWGSKYGNEKNELISKMDVFVHPSRNEGLPTAVLEAGSFGVPCIVSQATNVAEIVESHGAGYAIENENVQELSQAMEKLHSSWSSDNLAPYKANIKTMVKNEFSWSSIVDRFDAIYDTNTV